MKGGPGLDTIPFAVLRGALGVNDPTEDLSGLARQLNAALDHLATVARLLVVVDDAHLLDQHSAGLIYNRLAPRLSSAKDFSLLAGVRSGAPAPAALTAMWKDGLLERLELQPLSRLEATQLLVAVLGGSVEETTLERLWQITEGNPLYLREVILASHEGGALRQVSGLWRWRGRWAESTRLREVVAERLGRLDPEETTAIEALAVGGPLPIALLSKLCTPAALDRLEARGLVVEEGEIASLGHPVHVEVIRASMPAMRIRATCRNLVDASSFLPSTKGGAGQMADMVRLARWSVEAGIPVDSLTLRRAADATLWHVGQAIAARIGQVVPAGSVPQAPPVPAANRAAVIRMLTLAWEEGGGVDAGAALAVALAWMGNTAAAEEVLEKVTKTSLDADDALRLSIALAQVRFWGQRRFEDSIATLDRAYNNAPASSDLQLRAEVLEDWSGIELNVGRLNEALERASRSAALLGRDLASSPAAPPAAAALALLGRCGEALDLVERATPFAIVDTHRPLAAAQLMMARCAALGRAGRLTEALELAESCRSIAIDVGSIDACAVYSVIAGEALILQGRPASASRYLRDAAGLLSERDVLGYRPWALAALSHARAMLSDEAGAAATLALAEASQVMPRFFDGRLWLARSALQALQGRRPEAVEAAQAGQAHFRAAGMAVDEALALDAWMRLAPCSEAADRLGVLAGLTDSALVACLARHASALVQRNPEALLSVCSDLEVMPAWLLAAEAAAAAAGILTSRHNERAARAASRTAFELASHSEGASSELLGRLSLPGALTKREAEIVRLASMGHSNRDIAARLFVSSRTVETHLQHAYAKLGVRERRQLASVLSVEAVPEQN
jgi:DNA-binding NarL/FixJ family response regulator